MNSSVLPFEILLFLQILSLAIKGFFLIKIRSFSKNSPKPFLWHLLTISLMANCVIEAAWVNVFAIKAHSWVSPLLLNALNNFEIPLLQLAWIASIIDYFCLALFIERLADTDQYKMRRHNRIAGIGALLLTGGWIYQAISSDFGIFYLSTHFLIYLSIFYWIITLGTAIWTVIKNIRCPDSPKLLHKQVSIFINFLVVPRLFLDIVVMDPLGLLPKYYHDFAPATAIIASYIALYIIYFSARKMLGMRFLNVSDQVEGQARFNFIHDIKRVLQDLGHVASLQELSNIIRRFYEHSFAIPPEKIRLLIFGHDNGEDQDLQDRVAAHIHEPFMKSMPLLVRDELEFSYFYQKTPALERALACLNDAGADLLIPIYDKKNIIGCILALRSARPEKLFSAAEYDEMVVFNSYLGALVNLLKNRSLESLIQLEKDLKEELYLKHQEIKHYKEVIRDFMAKYQPDSNFRNHSALLKDPTDWDYLLFLQTSQTGKLIDKVIPGTGSQMLNFKINLLKTALSNKGVLIQLPEDDLAPTVELLHHISLKEHLEVLDCDHPEQNQEYALKLFGINPLYDKEHAVGLLERFDGSTTLSIRNVENLSVATQELLAHALHTGVFYPLKSDRKRLTQVRVMCCTTAPLAQAVHQNTFSSRLYNELMRTSATLPSLLTMQEEDLQSLTQGFAERITSDAYQNLDFELSAKERQILVENRPVSLKEYKERVYNLLVKKAKRKAINPEETFDEAYVEHGPELYQVAKLGKRALKDKQIMIFLWNKFKNQTKIAKILNVNRSSVNRRCKEFNLL